MLAAGRPDRAQRSSRAAGLGRRLSTRRGGLSAGPARRRRHAQEPTRPCSRSGARRAVVNGDGAPASIGVMAEALASGNARCRIAPTSPAGSRSQGSGEYRLALGALEGACDSRRHAARQQDDHAGDGARIERVLPRASCAASSTPTARCRAPRQRASACGWRRPILPRLQAVQRMLLRLGIASTIYRDRRAAGTRSLPDGRGGHAGYADQTAARAGHRRREPPAIRRAVSVSPTATSARGSRPRSPAIRRALNRERFVATVAAIDAGRRRGGLRRAAFPGINAFDANGFWSHNCGEQPLPPYGACLLGSINLARLVDEPFTAEARLDEARAGGARAAPPCASSTMPSTSRNYPLPAQRQEAKAKRRIGLGVTGLADALILCGVRYGTPKAVALAETLDGGDRARRLPRQRRARRARRAPSRCSTRERFLAAPNVAAPARGRARRRSPEHGIRNGAPDLDRADRHDLAVRRQRVERHRAGVRLPLRARACSSRDGTHAQRDGRGLCRTPLPRRCSGADAPLPEAFVTRQELTPARASRDAGGGAAPRRQLDLQDDQLPGRHRASRSSRTSTSRPTSWASRAARPTGRTR